MNHKQICFVIALVFFAISGFMGYSATASYAPWYWRFIAVGLFFLTLGMAIPAD